MPSGPLLPHVLAVPSCGLFLTYRRINVRHTYHKRANKVLKKTLMRVQKMQNYRLF
jgi:hypothetical protein